ncbi:MAG: type VI secretion system ImpA family N-terminal domain-containing protein [Spirochaetaceae bacterium]|jgi:type VI secretion system protein ImpA|nr:type VI secretion system ImpA family N-terminal domain-containing protein [Spirochaetaceae bacterium]
MIDIDELSKPLADGGPAGQNIEYDPLYLEMDELAESVPDSYMGDSKIAGRGPDWKTLRKNCLELWTRTRDLRIAVYLTITEAVTGGLQGFTEALRLPLFLVKELWDDFYPALDPADGNDPLERLNILSMLSPPPGSVNDPVMFIPRFRETRLIPSLRYTLRDLLISLNEIEAPADTVDVKLLRAEFAGAPAAEIETLSALAKEAKALILELCDTINAKTSMGSLDMSALNREIDHLIKFYDSYKTDDNKAGENAAAENAPDADSAGLKRQFAGFPSQAASRAEALLFLKKGAEYFQTQEPNSPIPLLVNRALRFSTMNFIDLIEDIMPDALPRGRDILGIKSESS